MARHSEILADFDKTVAGGFSFSNPEHIKSVSAMCVHTHNVRNMCHSRKNMTTKFEVVCHFHFQLKMLLIKCCDISNEVRPMEVSEPWVDCLLEEYFMQSDREKSEGLPVAPFMDRDKVTKPSAQIGFIKFVLIPLFEATTKVCVCVCVCGWVFVFGRESAGGESQSSLLERDVLLLVLFIQAVPEMSVMVESLQNSLEYYEQLKMMEDMLKEGTTAEVTMETVCPPLSQSPPALCPNVYFMLCQFCRLPSSAGTEEEACYW